MTVQLATQTQEHPAQSPWLDSDNDRSGSSTAPVFIIGVHRRCGSNFLNDALLLHPTFDNPRPLAEDYLLQSAHLLDEYVDVTGEKQWRKRYDRPEEFEQCKASLRGHFGKALTDFLQERAAPGKRLLTKTPDPDNLERFFSFLPEAKLVLLVRDGRDVVESSYRSWPSEPRKHWMKCWARGARIIGDFMECNKGDEGVRWKLFRYEDLLQGDKPLADVLEFVGIDPQSYPWETLNKLPIRGSSVERGGKMGLHWNPVDKPKNFNPVGRWSSWSWWRRRQFQKLAGRESAALGYTKNSNW